ncbi:hypothetical protein V8G54_030550 [Vigna mungo]|uniref:protein-serine/threonine phosphatase n=1 Tax=Vigna mungo TaxID=3915 RepID=A0AAQ3MX96_VIGMU
MTRADRGVDDSFLYPCLKPEQRYLYGRSLTGFNYAVPHPSLKIVTPYMCATITPIEATIIILVQGALQQSCDCGSKEFIGSDINSPDRASSVTSSKPSQSNLNYNVTTPKLDGGPDILSSSGFGMDRNSLEKLREASAAEAEAATAVWQAVQAISSSPAEETSASDENSQAAETVSDGSDTEGDVRLHPRAVVVAKEAVGNLGGMVRQLSLDQFENESRRMIPTNNDLPYPTKKFTRQKSPQGLHKKIISTLLRPRNWKAPANRRFFLDSYEVGELCYAAEQIFMHEPTVLQLKAPVKVFGDLHGQFGDLMRLFDEYGFPSTAGDIT